jgi:hypothetical protein
MVFRSHPIGACCVRSGRLQGFIPQKLAHFEEHILTLHTERGSVRGRFPFDLTVPHRQMGAQTGKRLSPHFSTYVFVFIPV